MVETTLLSQIPHASVRLRVITHADLPGTMWDDFQRAHPAGHILQSTGWARLKETAGWRTRRVGIVDESDALVAGAQILFRRMAGFTLAYVPRGPVVDFSNPALAQATFDALESCARVEGAFMLKMEPELGDTPANRALLQRQGFRPSLQTVQPPSTILLAIGDDDAAIQARMKSKWRYNIRLAARKGVSVRAAGPSDLAAFNQLMHDTGARDGFTVHAADYYNAAYHLFVPDAATYLLAEFDGQPLASIVVFVQGQTAWYLWGASSDRERNRMPNHALQWAAIQWARARGATRYDLWGIPDAIGKIAVGMQGDGVGAPVDDLPINVQELPGGELWGVYRFKQGFGGRVVRYVGAWDKPLGALSYQLYTVGISLREQSSEWRNLDFAQAAGRLRKPATTMPQGLQLVTQAAAWRTALADLPDPHVLQSWEWGEVKHQFDWHAERYVSVDRRGAPQAAFQFLSRQPLPQLPMRIGYIPKGPVVDWADDETVDITLRRIEACARAHGCVFVKIDPNVAVDSVAGLRLQHTLFRRGWTLSPEQIQIKNTAITDLTGDEETRLAEMKGKSRYNLRLAQRRGIQVREGTAADLAAFYALYEETSRRDDFAIRSFDYYAAVWQSYLAAETDAANPAGGVLLLAEHPEESAPVAGLFLMRYGARAWYFYGASSERRRRDMPNYLLQWEAMQWSRRAGCTVYDWWGAPDQLEDEDDRMQGVWRFKQSMGATFCAHVGAWDFVIAPPLYTAYLQAMPRVLETMRRVAGKTPPSA